MQETAKEEKKIDGRSIVLLLVDRCLTSLDLTRIMTEHVIIKHVMFRYSRLGDGVDLRICRVRRERARGNRDLGRNLTDSAASVAIVKSYE